MGSRWVVLLAWGVSPGARADGPLDREGPRGQIALVEREFTVGRKVTIEAVYTAGVAMGPGDEIRLDDPQFHSMRWSKWGDLSPWAEDCTAATESPPASWGRVTAHVERDGVEREDVALRVERSNCERGPGTCDPDLYLRAHTLVRVEAGVLRAGDEIVVVMGDTSPDGALDTSSCGFQVSDRAFPRVRWPMRECLGDKADCDPLGPVVISILPEPTASSVVAIVPSQTVVGEPLRVKVSLLDTYGNAVPTDPRELVLYDEDGQELGRHTLRETDGGWHDFEVTPTATGVRRYAVEADGLVATSNPVEVFETAPELGVYWGDIHVHNGYTWYDEDGHYHDYNHDYGRDVVGLDVVSESQKVRGVELDADEQWAELVETCETYTLDGHYVVMMGFEWIGDLAAQTYGTTTEGHHNVYYDRCDGELGTLDTDVIDSVAGPRGLWGWLDEVRDRTGLRAVTLPHAMQSTGYNYNVSYPGTQTLAEIYSSWGDNTEWSSTKTEEELAGGTQDLLRHGLRLGWIAASDNHNGWMGNPYAGKNVPGGLGAFLAPALTRTHIFEAMSARRTYATTGHRTLLRFQAEDGEVTVPPGAEYLASRPRFTWELYGTAPLKEFTVWGIEIAPDAVQTRLAGEQQGELDVSGGLSLKWDGVTPMAVWIQAVQEDGEQTWSSPIWITADCARLDEGATDPLGLCEPAAGSYGGSGLCGAARGGPAAALLALAALLKRRSRA